MSAEYNFRFRIDWNIPRFNLDLTAGYIGQVKVLGYPVVGSPTQAQIDAAVAQYIEDHPGALSPLSDDVKQAMLDCFAHVAWIDEHGQDYYDALYQALYARVLVSITAAYTQSGIVASVDSIDGLKSDLVVTATYSDGTTDALASTDYTLSGTLTYGTSTITVSYLDKTTTFTVSVTQMYRLKDVASTSVTSTGTSTISVTNGVVTVSGKAKGALYIKPDGTASATQPQGTPWWSAEAGDVIDWNIHDITWSAGSGSSQSLDFKWANADASGNLMSISKSVSSGSSGSNEDVIKNYPSYANTRNFSALAFQWMNNSSAGGSCSFTIELVVNGVKYF